MLNNPRLLADRRKLLHNTSNIVQQCQTTGIKVAGVTKSFCAHSVLAQAMVEAGVSELADSRLENLQALQSLPVPKMLLRLPQPSELAQVVQYANISLNSEVSTIRRLSREAKTQGKVHRIILMVELGDLREGLLPDDAPKVVSQIISLPGIELMGIGSNLTCLSGVLPTVDNMQQLVELALYLRQRYCLELPVISAGNSSCLYLVYDGKMPQGINHLRIGKAITLGREAAFGLRLPGLHDDVFTFQGEIIELKEKPTLPIGRIGSNTFGEKPAFVDRGRRARAIVAAGRQDIDPQSLLPVDEEVSVVGASSDHLVVELAAGERYRVGDELTFKVGYSTLLAGMTSRYVKKEIV